MKAIVVISLDLEPDQLVEVLDHLDPPRVPHFAGEVRIAIDDPARDQAATRVLNYLEGVDDSTCVVCLKQPAVIGSLLCEKCLAAR